MSNIKILIVPSWYPTKSNPLPGTFFREQALELSKKVNVAVLFIQEPIRIIEFSKLFQKKIHFFYDNSIFTVNYGYINWFPYCEFLKIFLYRRAVIKGYSIIKEEFGKPDVIHAQSIIMGGFGAIIINDQEHIPVIVTEHSSIFNDLFNSIRKKIAYNVLKRADYFTAVSNSLCNLVKCKGRNQCTVIPNFINEDKLCFFLEKMSNNSIFHLLNVSRLVPIKGIDILIRAMEIVVKEKKILNFHLDIIGDGPEKEKYLSIVKKLSLENYCTFHGEKITEELSQFYHQTNALVISSRSETFGIVGIEAMSLGKPIISTRCGGPEEYVTPDVGYLVENENPEKLAEGIIYVMNNYHKYSPQKIRETFLSNYSSDVVIEKWIKVYSDLMIKK